MKQEVFKNENSLFLYLKKYINGYRILGIDGVNGVGKTYLSNQLSQQFKIPVFHLDSYIKEEKFGVL